MQQQDSACRGATQANGDRSAAEGDRRRWIGERAGRQLRGQGRAAEAAACCWGGQACDGVMYQGVGYRASIKAAWKDIQWFV